MEKRKLNSEYFFKFMASIKKIKVHLKYRPRKCAILLYFQLKSKDNFVVR